jgi:hypothetical protein
MMRRPLEVNTVSNAVVKLRFPITDQELDMRAPIPEVYQPIPGCCATHSPVGWPVKPRMYTRRASTSITKIT